jgi:ketosteroid isomerase-like protein
MTTLFDDPQAQLAWMFLQCLGEGADFDECFGLLSDDFTYWSLTSRVSLDKAALRQEIERRKCRVEISLDLLRCVNDGHSVVVEAQVDGMTADGTRYESPCVFLFETRGGVITSLREYGDTRSAAQVFDAAGG